MCADFEVELVQFKGEGDHVHLLVHFPPNISLTKLINSLKGVSPRRLRQKFPDLVQHYWRAQKPWSVSYFDGAIGGAPPGLGEEVQREPKQAYSLEAIHLRPEGRSTLDHQVACH